MEYLVACILVCLALIIWLFSKVFRLERALGTGRDDKKLWIDGWRSDYHWSILDKIKEQRDRIDKRAYDSDLKSLRITDIKHTVYYDGGNFDMSLEQLIVNILDHLGLELTYIKAEPQGVKLVKKKKKQL